MCFGTVLDRLETILVHFLPNMKINFFFEISTILGHFWPFWAHFGPPKRLGSPKSEGGIGQNGPKGGPQAIKMCFGTVLDHLETTGPHLEAKKKSKKYIFLTFF